MVHVKGDLHSCGMKDLSCLACQGEGWERKEGGCTCAIEEETGVLELCVLSLQPIDKPEQEMGTFRCYIIRVCSSLVCPMHL